MQFGIVHNKNYAKIHHFSVALNLSVSTNPNKLMQAATNSGFLFEIFPSRNPVAILPIKTEFSLFYSASPGEFRIITLHWTTSHSFHIPSNYSTLYNLIALPDRPWCPHSLLSDGYLGLFPSGKAARA